MTTMPITEHNPDQSLLSQSLIATPYTSAWWVTQTLTNIPQDAVGWLVAQGWQITGVTYDTNFQPPRAFYAMTRQSLQNWIILQSLLASYVEAHNNAVTKNTIRYNDVVASWDALLDNTHDYFVAQAAEQDTHAVLFLGNLETYMDEVDVLIEANQNQIVLDAQTATTALTALDAKLTDLETNVTNTTATIEGLLTNQGTYLTTFLADFSAQLQELDTNYTAHLALINSELTEADTDLTDFVAVQTPQLAALQSAYTTAVSTLEGLLTTAGTDLTTLEGEVTALLSSLSSDYTDVDTDVTALLSSGTVALNTFASDFDTTLDLLTTDYTSIAGELNDVRALSTSAFNDHKTDYELAIEQLEPDYTSHSETATEFLTGLGTTDLARINEQFASTLATQIQQLTDRGLYSSALVTDITSRNHRDRDEQIQALNDRLMREKWENQHRIYGQQTDMRARVMDAKGKIHGVEQDLRISHVGQITSRFSLQQSARDRTLAGIDRLHAVKQEVYRYQASQIVGIYQLLLGVRDRTLAGRQAVYAVQDADSRLNITVQSQLYEAGNVIKRLLIDEAARLDQLQFVINQWQTTERHHLLEQIQAIETQNLAGLDKQHAAQQDISRVAMTEREQLLVQLQAAVKGVIDGKDRYAAATMQIASTIAEHKHKVIVEKMNESAARLSGLDQKHAETMKLMAYMLDERNKLTLGLYGFVERREDAPPSFDALTQIATGLGDAGGGWVTP